MGDGITQEKFYEALIELRAGVAADVSQRLDATDSRIGRLEERVQELNGRTVSTATAAASRTG